MGVIGRMTGRRGAEEIEERIRAALAELRPLVAPHASRVDLLAFTAGTGTATLVLEGGCPDCEMPAAALLDGIGAHLRARVPEVRDVRAADSYTPDNG
jgi:Fe-S cluster biogenesis protein NfuA